MLLITLKHYVHIRQSGDYLFQIFTALILLSSLHRVACLQQTTKPPNEAATTTTTVSTTTQETPSNSSEVLFSSEEFVDHKEAPVLLFDGGLANETHSQDETQPATVAPVDLSAVNGTTATSVGAVEPNREHNNNKTQATSEIIAKNHEDNVDPTPASGDESNPTSDESETDNDDNADDDETNRDNNNNNSNNQKQFKPPQNVSQYMDYIEALFHDLGHQITDLFEPHIPQLIRTSQMVELSGSCSYDMLRMALALRHFEPWALRMIDSSGKVPEGIFEGSFTALGSYDECLNTVFKSTSSHSASSQQQQQQQQQQPNAATEKSPSPPSATQGKYCLVNVSPFLPPKPPADKVERMFQEEANRRNYTKDDQFSRLSPMFYYMKFRIGVCIPSTCDQGDMESISQALSSSLRLNITIPDCRVKQATPMTSHQFAGGLVFASVFSLVLVATLVDWSRRNWNQIVEQEFGALIMNLAKHHHHHRAQAKQVDSHGRSGSVVLTGMTKCSQQQLGAHSRTSRLAAGGQEDGPSSANSKRMTFYEQLEKHWAWMSFSVLTNFKLYFKQSTIFRIADAVEKANHPNQRGSGPPAARKSDQSITMIKCLNGIRVLSLCWVMIANSYITLDPRATKRLLKTREAPRDFLFQLVVQASLAIETFFFLSGILMSLSFARQLARQEEEAEEANDIEKNNRRVDSTRGKWATFLNWLQFYVHRYVRMTPPTMLVIAISMYAYRYGDGPLWFEATHKSHQNCRENWWRHLLHVANFIDTRQMCFIHYWYIAADMQLFLFAPLVMFLVYRYRRVGYSLIALIGAASMGFIFYTTYERNLPPTLLFYNSDPESRREFGNTIMTKPLTHALPYLVGMLVGHWLTNSSHQDEKSRLANSSGDATRQQQQQQILLKNYGRMSLATLLGSTAAVIALVELFLPYKWNNSQLPTRFMASLYAALFRFGWSLVLAYVVVSCRHRKDRKCLRRQWRQEPQLLSDNCCCCRSYAHNGDGADQWPRTHGDHPVNTTVKPNQPFDSDAHLKTHCCAESSRTNHGDRLLQQQRPYCFCGSGGNLINRLLSLSIFTHLSKLSFVAYLIHLPLMSVFISQTRGLFAFSHTLVIHLALSYLVMTFVLSFILVHIIEFPFITFERYLFNNLLRKQHERGKKRSETKRAAPTTSGDSQSSMRFAYENKSMSFDGDLDVGKASSQQRYNNSFPFPQAESENAKYSRQPIGCDATSGRRQVDSWRMEINTNKEEVPKQQRNNNNNDDYARRTPNGHLTGRGQVVLSKSSEISERL